MKRIASVLAFLLMCATAFAQDIITKRDGEDIRAKVLEVSQDEVRYVRESYPDGPQYVIPKTDILLITYQDGAKDIFSGYKAKRPTNTLPESEIARLSPNMKYSELKKFYNYKDYDRFIGEERYNPSLMGVCSFMIPGLGQVISGETGRGILQFLGVDVLMCLGLCTEYSGIDETGRLGKGAGLTAIACFCGATAIYIFSIVDAVRVAKVRNMYKEDIRNYSANISLSPYCDFVCLDTKSAPVAGLSFKLSF